MASLFLTPWVAIAFYGSIMAVVWAMCEAGPSIALRQIARWLGADWIVYNLVFAWLHAAHAPWLAPSLSAIVCIGVASIAIRRHSNVAWWVVSLFVVGFAFTVASFLAHQQGTVTYYLVLNLVFLGRMIVLGEAGYVELVSGIRGRYLLPGAGRSGLARHRHF